MEGIRVLLHSVEEVNKLVDAANLFDCEIDVVADRYCVNAKSVLGLFSLDLQTPVEVRFYGSDAERARFLKAIGPQLAE